MYMKKKASVIHQVETPNLLIPL